jgi:hypothetical protein
VPVPADQSSGSFVVNSSGRTMPRYRAASEARALL